jgi:hypothetical protein
MKPPNTMTVTEFASMGGIARAKALTKKRMSEIARMGAEGAKASGKKLGRPKNQKQLNQLALCVPLSCLVMGTGFRGERVGVFERMKI